ncbi:MAG: hypothetical protein ABI175_16810 [Polyangiales bacterium]
MRALFLAVLAVGCGRWHFDAEHHDLDAREIDAPPRDAEGTCNAALPFGSPVLIASINSSFRDGTLRLSEDELRGYFWSFRSGRGEIYYATRPSRVDPFTVAVVSGLSTSGNDLDPSPASDGSIFVYRRNGPGDALWFAIPQTPTSFTGADSIAGLDTASVEAQPYLQPTGNALVFQSTRSGAGDLYRSTRTGLNFTAPALITELATVAIEGDPVLSVDGLTLYFRSDAPAALGGFNIYETNRATPTGAFGTPVLLEGVSSEADDGPSFLSPDHCRLYLSSDHGGTNHIYVATRGT